MITILLTSANGETMTLETADLMEAAEYALTHHEYGVSLHGDEGPVSHEVYAEFYRMMDVLSN
jgi:hypothetical protein